MDAYRLAAQIALAVLYPRPHQAVADCRRLMIRGPRPVVPDIVQLLAGFQTRLSRNQQPHLESITPLLVNLAYGRTNRGSTYGVSALAQTSLIPNLEFGCSAKRDIWYSDEPDYDRPCPTGRRHSLLHTYYYQC
jgi:hypothetical protein